MLEEVYSFHKLPKPLRTPEKFSTLRRQRRQRRGGYGDDEIYDSGQSSSQHDNGVASDASVWTTPWKFRPRLTSRFISLILIKYDTTIWLSVFNAGIEGRLRFDSLTRITSNYHQHLAAVRLLTTCQQLHQAEALELRQSPNHSRLSGDDDVYCQLIINTE